MRRLGLQLIDSTARKFIAVRPDQTHQRKLITFHPFRSACSRSVSSGFTATGVFTIASNGRSFSESL